MKSPFRVVVALVLAFVCGAVATFFIVRKTYVEKLSGTYENWYKLNYVLSSVEANYVDTLDRKSATDAMLEAALQSLDPHSVYMLPEPLKESDESLAGDFEGVGLQFNVPNDTAIVLSAIPGGPSEKAGIQSGDRIIKVDDKVIAGVKMPQDSMVRLMRGPKGTKVVLTMGRGNEKIPFEIVRDKIAEHSVDASFLLEDGTGYLRISKFSRTTYSECMEAMCNLREEGMKRLVIDLRSNTGGYLDQCCLLVNEFLKAGSLIVYTEGRSRSREEFKADGRGQFLDLPLVVLIDDGSASASEILAGAVQDNDRGTIVGRRSFGKGLVQEPFYFSDGTGIRLTVARFHTPSGRCIQKPFGDDYNYEFYNRYKSGELMSADSIKVDSSKVYSTIGGRTVFGGGGIIPDVFVPMDTTKASRFYVDCNKKAAVMRYAAYFADHNRSGLSTLSTFPQVSAFIEASDVEKGFLAYTAAMGIKPSAGEWESTREYMLPQIKGLCARYARLGEEALYRYTISSDDVLDAALKAF